MGEPKTEPKPYETPGPFLVSQVREGDRYELSNGHPIYCAPTGSQGGRAEAAGARALTTDPDVVEAGIDVGYSNGPRDLRAPDISVGNVPDARGWAKGAPPLAVEYADVGQNEADLAAKIPELLSMGTKYVWVVRLAGPRRVEVHEAHKDVVTYGPGSELVAPGVLRNAVPVEALWDFAASDRVALRNLLQRFGYLDLDTVRKEAREEARERGREEGRRLAVLDLAELLGLEVDDARKKALDAMGAEGLDQLRAALKRERRFPTP